MSQSELFTPKTLSVSELTGEIKTLLEGNFLDLNVEGEVSNASTSRSGHTYFTLKDEEAQLSCVIWRGVKQRLGTALTDGQQIMAVGDIQVYPPHGKYQLIVRTVEQAGVGALQKAFEKLKAQLKHEGLFDDIHKKELPNFPMEIGVITSATGAAFHDITHTLKKRWPLAKVRLHHASVQGVKSASELVKAIRFFSEEKSIDVLIIGRGGGSLEDLWPFNEEAVARAIYACNIPTISAVGHEVDFSISDFVADARTATPTQAAIVATPDINEVRMFADDLSQHLATTTTDRLQALKQRVQQLAGAHALLKMQDVLSSYAAKLQNLEERLYHAQQFTIIHKRNRLTFLQNKLETKNPKAALQQGYARIWQEDDWIKSLNDFETEKKATIEWKDGQTLIITEITTY